MPIKVRVILVPFYLLYYIFIISSVLHLNSILSSSYFSDFNQRCAHTGSAMIFYIVGYVIFIISYFAIACCERVRKKSPGNIIAISIFTLSLSLMVAMICLFHDVIWVLQAMGITAALCLGITLFAFQTKIDFTGKTR